MQTRLPDMARSPRQPLASAWLVLLLLAGCAHTTAKVNAAGSERGYSSNGEVKVGLPF